MDSKTKPITEKYALDYYRRSRPTRAWKLGWNIAALFVAAALIAGIYLFERDAAFHAAPVSSAHSMFGDHCERCHDQNGGTARRLVTLSGEFRSVSDNACQSCHSAAEHQTGRVAGPVCVACHQEHRPDRELSHVMDSNCIDCHQQLELDDATAAVSFAGEISQFASGRGEHPEFALLRCGDADVGPRHRARDVAARAAADDGGDGDKRWLDRGGLKFNHKLHLDPDGVLLPDRTRRTLDCADCHVPDVDGGYMQPIEYERNCAECHPLRLTDSLAAVGEIPHSSVEEVRGMLRERLSRLRLEELPEAAAARSSTNRAATRRLPLLPTPEVLSEADEQKVDALMRSADHAVFGLEAKGMCRHCHHVDVREGQWHVSIDNPAIAQDTFAATTGTMNMLPDRWFAHARFDHRSHRAIQCGDCHAAHASSATADILLPSIAVCRTCHGGAAGTNNSRVSAECVLCHSYHDKSQMAHGVPLEQLLSGTQLETASPASP